MNKLKYNYLFKEFYQILKYKTKDNKPSFETINKLIEVTDNLSEFEKKYKNNMDDYQKQCQRSAQRNNYKKET